MSRLRRANVPQRVVVVVALAALLALAGSYVVTDGFSRPAGGWFGYAPLSDLVLRDPGLDPFPRLLVWAAIVVVWAVISFWVFGLPAPGGDDADAGDD